jgi:hypothetical protein
MRVDAIFGRKSGQEYEAEFAEITIRFLSELFQEEQEWQRVLVEADRLHDAGSLQGELILLYHQLESMPLPEQIRSPLYQRCFELQHTLRAQANLQWGIDDLVFERGVVVGIQAPVIQVFRWLHAHRETSFLKEFPWVQHWNIDSAMWFQKRETIDTATIKIWLQSILSSHLGHRFVSLGIGSQYLKIFLEVMKQRKQPNTLRALYLINRFEKRGSLPKAGGDSFWNQLTHLQIDWHQDHVYLKNLDQWLKLFLTAPTLELIDIDAHSPVMNQAILDGILRSPMPRLRTLVWRWGSSMIEPPVDQLCLLCIWLEKHGSCQSLLEINGWYKGGILELPTSLWTPEWWQRSKIINEIRIVLPANEIPDFVEHADYQTTKLDLLIEIDDIDTCELFAQSRVLSCIRSLDIQNEIQGYLLQMFLSSPELCNLESLHIKTIDFHEPDDAQYFLNSPWHSSVIELGINIELMPSSLMDNLLLSEPPPKLIRFHIDMSGATGTDAQSFCKSTWLKNVVFLSMIVNFWGIQKVSQALTSPYLQSLRDLRIHGSGNHPNRVLGQHQPIQIELPNLETINDSYEHGVEWLLVLANSNNQRIRKIRMFGKKIPSLGPDAFVRAKKGMWLEELDLDSSELLEGGLIALGKARHFQHLRAIYGYSIAFISDNGLRSWLGVSLHFPLLKTVVLGNYIHKYHAVELVQQLRDEWGERLLFDEQLGSVTAPLCSNLPDCFRTNIAFCNGIAAESWHTPPGTAGTIRLRGGLVT